MNRKNLTAAVLAGLAGAAGIASTAQAVNLNPDGLGQVLLYPYYTVNGGNATLMSVVNTTGQGKAVKVRYLEGVMSVEVLDFNLYMSEYDVWTAAIVADDDGYATLFTEDTSCTVPQIPAEGVSFRNLKYAGDPDDLVYTEGDGGDDSLDRATEGHIEIIEMASICTMDAMADEGLQCETDLEGAVEYYTTHVTDPDGEMGDEYGLIAAVLEIDADDVEFAYGSPRSCAPHQLLWTENAGPVLGSIVGLDTLTWRDAEGGDSEFAMADPSGGLFGGGSVVNANKGSMYAYDATAIEGIRGIIEHTDSKNPLPSLGTGQEFEAWVYDAANAEMVGLLFAREIDAVSAIFMHDSMMNEYTVEDLGGGVNARTEWVVTFPTKSFYVDSASATMPFTQAFTDNWDSGFNDGACEIIKAGPGERGIWNREEETIFVPTQPPPGFVPPGFSPSPSNPPPDAPPIPTTVLCYETSVVRFGENPAAEGFLYGGPTEILGSTRPIVTNVEPIGENGWAQVDLSDGSDPNEAEAVQRELCDETGYCVIGLPIVGFAAMEFQNGLAPTSDGGLATQHYGGIFSHKATRMVSLVGID